MKKTFTVLMTVCCLYASAQNVGINTNNPATTLQVVGQPGNTNIADGITIPKLTGNQLRDKDAVYTATQTGALVYVTAAASPTNAKTINVTAAGFYYFDGTVWQKAAATSAIDTTNDAFENDAANTMVKLKTTSNGVTSRASNAEFVIRDDGKVGIGFTAPGRMLDVNGSANVTDELTIRRGATEGGQLTLQGQTGADADWTIDQVNNASNPRFRIFGGASEGNGINITQTGNVSAPNGWVRGFASGQLLNTVFIDDPGGMSPVTTSNTTVITLFTQNYTPVHNNSKIMVQYHNNSYRIGGNSGSNVSDEFRSQLIIGSITPTTNLQICSTEPNTQTSNSLSQFRTGSLFPISGVATNSSTSSITIRVQVARTAGDDDLTVNLTNGTLIIQEIAQ